MSNGLFQRASAAFTVAITRANTAPVALDDAYPTSEGTILAVSAPGVLANDIDGESDPLVTVLESGPMHGSLILDGDGSFSYQPATGFAGSDTFTYGASDGSLVSQSATVVITVARANRMPVARGEVYTTREGTPLAVPAPGVLGNDTDRDSDPLTASSASGPTHGTLTLNINGSLRYRPARGFAGTDTFTYRASDGRLASSPATVTIRVNPLPVCQGRKATIVGTPRGEVIRVDGPGPT